MTVETARRAAPHDHVVQFYADDRELADTVGAYLGDGLRAGEVVIVVATDAHVARFEAVLRSRGIDVDAARADAALVTLDATETLAGFMVGDGPDPAAFDSVIGGLVRTAAASSRAIRAYGEMVAILWEAGNVGAAIELEALWNDLAVREPFRLFCAYPSA